MTPTVHRSQPAAAARRYEVTRLSVGSCPVAEFASRLRALRAAAGNITYRRMAASAHYSPTVLSRAANGRLIPTWLAVALMSVPAAVTWWSGGPDGKVPVARVVALRAHPDPPGRGPARPPASDGRTPGRFSTCAITGASRSPISSCNAALSGSSIPKHTPASVAASPGRDPWLSLVRNGKLA